MRIVVGRGSRRQEWEVSPKDYDTKRNMVDALLKYIGLKRI